MSRSQNFANDKGNPENELIRSNFIESEETSLLSNNSNADNSLMKQLNRLLALKDLPQRDSRLKRSDDVKEQLLKREERKIINLLRKENMEIADLNDRLEQRVKKRVEFDIPSNNHTSSMSEPSDDEVHESSYDDVDGDYKVNNDSSSESLNLPYRNDTRNPKNSEKLTNPKDKCHSNDVKPLSPPKWENCDLKKTETKRLVVKRPFLKKGAGIARLNARVSQRGAEKKFNSLPGPEKVELSDSEEFVRPSTCPPDQSTVIESEDDTVKDFVESSLPKRVTSFMDNHSSCVSLPATQLVLKKSIPIRDNLSALAGNCEQKSVGNLTRNEASIPSFSKDKLSTGPSHLISLANSDAEEDPDLHLFELLETMSGHPGFSEFAGLAQKVVDQNKKKKEISEDLRIYRELIADKKNLESIQENLIKDKISLVKIIEELKPEVDALHEANETLERQSMLDLQRQKECWEQEKQSILREQEMLLKSTKDLLDEQKILVSETMSLEEENTQLEKDNLQLLQEKENWTKEMEELSATTQQLIVGKEQLLKQKRVLLAEKNNSMDRSYESPECPFNNHEILHNGDVAVSLKNGTTKYTDKNGWEYKFVYRNGDIKELQPDGSIQYFYRESNIMQITQPDETIVMKFPNGQVETVTPDGSKTVVYANGTVRKIRSNGTEEYLYPDNTVAVSETNGVRCIKFTNGEKEYHHQHFTKRVYPDGTVKTLYEDGSSETKWINGRVRAKDPSGKLIYDTGEPSAPEFVRDTRMYNGANN